jgi:hypothetical protein
MIPLLIKGCQGYQGASLPGLKVSVYHPVSSVPTHCTSFVIADYYLIYRGVAQKNANKGC